MAYGGHFLSLFYPATSLSPLSSPTPSCSPCTCSEWSLVVLRLPHALPHGGWVSSNPYSSLAPYLIPLLYLGLLWSRVRLGLALNRPRVVAKYPSWCTCAWLDEVVLLGCEGLMVPNPCGFCAYCCGSRFYRIVQFLGGMFPWHA